MNRAVAHGRAFGPDAGLAVLEQLDAGVLDDSPLVPSVHGDLLERAGLHAQASEAFTEAAARTRNESERALLHRRAELNLRRASDVEVSHPRRPSPGPGPRLGVWPLGAFSRQDRSGRARRRWPGEGSPAPQRMLNVSRIAWLDGPMSKQPMTSMQEAIADVLVRVMLGDSASELSASSTLAPRWQHAELVA